VACKHQFQLRGRPATPKCCGPRVQASRAPPESRRARSRRNESVSSRGRHRRQGNFLFADDRSSDHYTGQGSRQGNERHLDGDPTPKIPRVIGRKGSMIRTLMDETRCRITVAQNGRICWLGRRIMLHWPSSSSIRSTRKLTLWPH